MIAEGRGRPVRPDAWMDDAACLNVDPDMFFPDTDRHTTQIARAKAVCASCPVRDACLEYALRTGVTDGVWGGMTTHERANLRLQRGMRARPVTVAAQARADRNDRVRAMRRSGVRLRDIAARLGMNESTVSDVCRGVS